MKKRFLGLIFILAISLAVFSACDRVEFKISFMVDDEVYATVITNGNETIRMPADPVKTGHTFAGWYWDEGIWNQPFTANSLLDAPLSSNMSVYARWLEGENNPNLGKLIVKFDSRGGDAVEDKYIDKGDSLPMPETYKEGYLLDGWYTSVNGITLDEKWSFLNNTVSLNMTLYAKWFPITYKVAYDANTGTGTEMLDTAHTYDESKVLRTNAYTKTGYTFNGWNTKADGSGTAHTNGESVINLTNTHENTVTLYAQWQANSYTVRYNANKPDSASGTVTNTMEDVSHVFDADKALTQNAFALKGWSFAGWNTEADGTGTNYANGANVKNLTAIESEAVDLFAQWTPNNYTIAYNKNKPATATATVEGNMDNSSHIYDVAKNVTTGAYSLTGWRFMGWNTEADGTGTAYQDNASIVNLSAVEGSTGNLYAQWTANNYTITYSKNKPDTATASVEGNTVNSSHTYDLAKSLTSNSYTLTGWRFVGWSQNADGSGTQYTNAQSVVNLDTRNDETVTLYAKWEANTYTIEYNANKPSIASNSVTNTMSSSSNTYDIAKILTENEFALVGWTFNGWNLLPNGTGTAFIDMDGVKNLSSVHGDTVTLYAQWSPIEYTVSYDYQNATGGDNESEIVVYYDNNYTLAVPSRIGYIFSGWYSLAGGGTQYTSIDGESLATWTELNGRTLYAKWTPISYTISYDDNKPATASNDVTGNTASSSHIYDTAKNINGALSLTGWTFNGWKDSDNNAYFAGESVINLTDENNFVIELFAQWTENKYNISFDKNGGSGEMSNMSNIKYEELIALTPSSFTSNQVGYKFGEWNTAADGSGVSYSNSAVVSCLSPIDNTVVTLYAQWTTPISYTVVYHANKPSGASNAPTGSTTTSTHNYDELDNLTANGFGIEGWAFANWNTLANANGTLYTDGQSIINLATEDGAVINLYAQWYASSYVVFYMYGGATGGNLEANKTVVFDQPFTLAKPTYGSYVFSGWYTEIGGGGTQLTDGDGVGLQNWNISSNTILYVHWTGTEGLAYSINGNTASVTGIGTATATEIVISGYYQGKKVTSIGSQSFYNCSNLTSIQIPSSVTSIGERAFYNCSNLTSIAFEAEIQLASISSFAFYGCINLTSIEIPSSVTSIGNSAFSGCSNLTSIVIPSSVTSIGNYAFYGCSNLTSIEIPSSVTSIGSSAFEGCSSLTSIQIPSSVTRIEEGAFRDCSSLTSVEIPSSVTSIGNSAFSGCSNLTSIVIPSSVTSIGNYAFYGCSNLTSIEIPSSVTSIGDSAFNFCSSLTIYVEATEKPNGWHDDWNYSNRPVVWGFAGDNA